MKIAFILLLLLFSQTCFAGTRPQISSPVGPPKINYQEIDRQALEKLEKATAPSAKLTAAIAQYKQLRRTTQKSYDRLLKGTAFCLKYKAKARSLKRKVTAALSKAIRDRKRKCKPGDIQAILKKLPETAKEIPEIAADIKAKKINYNNLVETFKNSNKIFEEGRAKFHKVADAYLNSQSTHPQDIAEKKHSGTGYSIGSQSAYNTDTDSDFSDAHDSHMVERRKRFLTKKQRAAMEQKRNARGQEEKNPKRVSHAESDSGISSGSESDEFGKKAWDRGAPGNHSNKIHIPFPKKSGISSDSESDLSDTTFTAKTGNVLTQYTKQPPRPSYRHPDQGANFTKHQKMSADNY